MKAFVKDRSQNAYEKLVDRLLASPHYGEQRAHYWLDAARYADTQGLHIDNYREMWPYRDWVIQALQPRSCVSISSRVNNSRGISFQTQRWTRKSPPASNVAMSQLMKVVRFLPKLQAMYAKDRADTTGTVWLGLTVGCATCHDHKFDPISQKDYYALTSFFRNTTQYALDGNVPDTPPTVVVPGCARPGKMGAS